MDRDALDAGREVMEGVDLALGATPIVALNPILDQVLQVIEIGALLPSIIGEVGCEACALKPLP
jgi:hypothetical protein